MNATEIALLKQELKYIKDALLDTKEASSKEHASVICKLDAIFEVCVSKTEFQPVKAIVYWLVGIILVAAIWALLRLIFI